MVPSFIGRITLREKRGPEVDDTDGRKWNLTQPEMVITPNLATLNSTTFYCNPSSCFSSRFSAGNRRFVFLLYSI